MNCIIFYLNHVNMGGSTEDFSKNEKTRNKYNVKVSFLFNFNSGEN